MRETGMDVLLGDRDKCGGLIDGKTILKSLGRGLLTCVAFCKFHNVNDVK